MKLLPGFIIISLIFFVLNRSYSYFYYHINSQNLPNPNNKQIYLLNEGGGEKKVYVSLGDSLSAGVGANDIKNSFTYKFAEKVSRKNSLDFYNFAAPGHRTDDLITDQLPRLKELKVDFITLLIGTNNIHHLTLNDSFKKDIPIIFKELQLTGAKVYVISIPYLGSPNILKTPFEYLLDWKSKQYNQILLSESEKFGFTYIDIYEKSKKQFSIHPEYYSSDEFHPSDKGYQYWGGIINAD